MFESIALVSVPVSDQRRAKEFYTKVLGCRVVQEMPFGTPDTLWIRLALPGVETELVLATWFPQMKAGSLNGLVLTTENIADAHAALSERGLQISDVREEAWGQEATFHDPDGNGWVLQQRPIIAKASDN